MWNERVFKGLWPFYIYWGILLMGCILFFWQPVFFLLLFSVSLILLFAWAVLVFLVGEAMQRRVRLFGRRVRFLTALLCTALTVLIFPSCSFVYGFLKGGKLKFSEFGNCFTDMVFWIVFLIHFLLLWGGMECASGEK